MCVMGAGNVGHDRCRSRHMSNAAFIHFMEKAAGS